MRNITRPSIIYTSITLWAVVVWFAFNLTPPAAWADNATNHLNQSFLLGGIQVHEENHTEWVQALKKNGFNAVSVTVYGMQGDWDSANFWWPKEDKGLSAEVTAARENGVKSVLIARVALDHAFKRNQSFWHGMIAPGSKELLDEWFRRYTEFVLHWAKFAEEQKVSVFGIGSEMNFLSSTMPTNKMPDLANYYLAKKDRAEELAVFSELTNKSVEKERAIKLISERKSSTELHTNWVESVYGTLEDRTTFIHRVNAIRSDLNTRWRKLISEVRKVYSGPLTYAANFDQYHEVGFWNDLDIMGINAYFKLRELKSLDRRTNEEILKDLENGWSEVFSKIDFFREEQDLELPVMFTELGYRFRKNATVHPWTSGDVLLDFEDDKHYVLDHETQPVDFKERTLAIRALRKVTDSAHPNTLKGILYWKLSSHEYHRDDEPFLAVLSEEKDREFIEALGSFRE